jgi:hypothetical protein
MGENDIFDDMAIDSIVIVNDVVPGRVGISPFFFQPQALYCRIAKFPKGFSDLGDRHVKSEFAFTILQSSDNISMAFDDRFDTSSSPA